MTSLLPLLPELPALPGPLAPGVMLPPAEGAAGRDFAGLLDAAGGVPSPVAAPAAPLAADAPPVLTAALPPVAAVLPGLPGGKALPEAGALLPPALPPMLSPTVAGEEVVAALPLAVAEAVAEAEAEAAPQTPAPRPADAAAEQPEPSEPRSIARAAPKRALAEPEAAPADGHDAIKDAAAPADEATASDNPAPAVIVAVLPTPAPTPGSASAPASAPQLLVVTLPLAQALPDEAVTASMPSAIPRPVVPARSGTIAPVSVTGAAAVNAEPALLTEPEPAAGLPATSAPVSDAAAPAPSGPAPASAPPASLAPPVPLFAAAPLPDQPVETRALAPAAAQIESTIAQVGDIREALRSARPAMTLQHAEFGAVSIRLEPAAPDQWRAVLASRDPGFVPAIHAALDARAIAATGDAAANFAGQQSASQNGAGDQRYGASPNGGQGSSQPYLGQSGQRDGEAASGHRRPSTAAALAARSEDGAEERGGHAAGAGGLFA